MTPHIAIARVAVYSLDGALRRTLDFGPGLNVVTGPSSRGKSSILDIIDYCLLSKHCRISKGVIRNRVGSVGVEFVRSDGQRLAIIRPLPSEGRLTTSQVALYTADGSVLPERTPDHWDWNLDAAKEAVSVFSGIEAAPVLTSTHEGQGPPAVNVRHAAPFLFQPQDVVASRNVAFPGLTDGFAKLHFSDASYYFLGLLSMEFLQGREELERLRSELQLLIRQIAHEDTLRTRSLAEANRLISEAKALGLHVLDGVEGVREARAALSSLARTKIASPEEATATASLAQQQESEAAARGEVESLRRDLASIGRAIHVLSEADGARAKLIERLGFREILPDTEHTVACPLCNQGTIDAATERALLQGASGGLDVLQDRSSRRGTELQREARRLQNELATATARLSDSQRALGYLFRQTSEHRTVVEEWRRRERLIGRAAHLLTYLQPDDSERQARIDELRTRVLRLEADYGARVVRELKKRADEALATAIAKLTARLDVEFPGVPTRIDFEGNMIELQLDSQWVPLSEIGSGANWVGYHVAAMIALHDYFAQNNSPVPRFIAFDQPSQAWFPPEEAKSGALTPSGRKELDAVRRIFGELHRLGTRGVQVIVADHASLSDAWFQDSIRANWHEGGGLVPDDW